MESLPPFVPTMSVPLWTEVEADYPDDQTSHIARQVFQGEYSVRLINRLATVSHPPLRAEFSTVTAVSLLLQGWSSLSARRKEALHQAFCRWAEGAVVAFVSKLPIGANDSPIDPNEPGDEDPDSENPPTRLPCPPSYTTAMWATRLNHTGVFVQCWIYQLLFEVSVRVWFMRSASQSP